MARNPISTARARRNVRIAQMAAVALGVSAGALWALQVPGIQEPLPEKPHIEPPAVAIRPVQQPQGPAMDSEQVAAAAVRLEVAANIQREPAAAPPDVAPVAQPTEWKYLAPIREPSRMLAVVSRGGRQKVMAPGREWDGATLLAVNEDKIVIEDSSGRHDILRGERTGSAVNWTKLPPPNSLGSRTQMDPNMASIERQMQARGIEGGQAARFREEMRRSRRRAESLGLSLEVMRAMGIDEHAVSQMSADELQAIREKYQIMTETGEMAAEIMPSQAVPPESQMGDGVPR